MQITGLIRVGQGMVAVTFNAPPGRNCQLQARQTLSDPWSKLGDPFVSQQAEFEFLEAVSGSSRFYRLLVLE